MPISAERLKEILISKVVSAPKDGDLVLKDQDHQVRLFDAPSDLVAVNLGKIGNISELAGFKEGGWKKSCDYLLMFQIARLSRRSIGGRGDFLDFPRFVRGKGDFPDLTS